MPFPPVDPVAAATTIAPVAVQIAKKWYKKYTSKDRGSKVKRGNLRKPPLRCLETRRASSWMKKAVECCS